MLALSKSDGFRSTTTPSPSPPPDSSSRCALSVSARASLPLHRHPKPKERSAFLSSLATRHSPLTTMFFRITSFAAPNQLTFIESILCKNQRGGISQLHPSHFSTPSTHPTHSIARNSNPVMQLRTLSVTHGGVHPSSSSFAFPFSNFALSISPLVTRHSPLPTYKVPPTPAATKNFTSPQKSRQKIAAGPAAPICERGANMAIYGFQNGLANSGKVQSKTSEKFSLWKGGRSLESGGQGPV